MRLLIILLLVSFGCSAQMIKTLPNSSVVDTNTWFITQEFLGGFNNWSLAKKTPANQIKDFIGSVSSVNIYNSNGTIADLVRTVDANQNALIIKNLVRYILPFTSILATFVLSGFANLSI